MRAISSLFILIPFALLAQEPMLDSLQQRAVNSYRSAASSFLSPQDSVAFTRFLAEMDVDQHTDMAPRSPADYHLVWFEWREDLHSMVLRGDGRTLWSFLQDPPPAMFNYRALVLTIAVRAMPL